MNRYASPVNAPPDEAPLVTQPGPSASRPRRKGPAMRSLALRPSSLSRSLVAVGPALWAAALCAAAPIYSNAGSDPNESGLATGAVSASGVAAPSGFLWSELQAFPAGQANAIAGFACNSTGELSGVDQPFSFADDFTVPSGPAQGRWLVSSASFFAYTLSTNPSSPFSSVAVQIWRGRPDDPASTIIFGDLHTNRLTSATPLNAYRIFNSNVPPFPAAPTTARRLWRLDVDLGNVNLPSNTYWIQWQVLAIDPQAEVFCPPITVANARGKPGSNAMQLRPGLLGASWWPLVDLGKPSTAGDVAQDLPFILSGTVACAADLSSGGSPTPDGTVDGTDFVAFINSFAIGDVSIDPLADVNGDGVIDGSDFVAFINAFAVGC